MKKRVAERVAKYWGQFQPCMKETFFGFPPLANYLAKCILGRPLEEYAQDGPSSTSVPDTWFIDVIMSGQIPVERCLSLCCGFGGVERHLAARGVFRHCMGLDCSANAVKCAQEQARAAGVGNVEYRVADLNHISLETDSFDLVIAVGGLHHLIELDHVASEVRKALRPGGVFICNEYVGPNYQKVPCRQREIINAVIHLLPDRLRHACEETFVPRFWSATPWRRGLYEIGRLMRLKAPSVDGEVWQPGESCSIGERLFHSYVQFRTRLSAGKARTSSRFVFGKVWDENSRAIRNRDPSECVRSADIIPVLRRTFGDLDVRYYNGSILYYALDRRFYRHFDARSGDDRMLLQMLIDIEETMIRLGELSADHAQIIAQKPVC
jgi:SAM-dependent methyltransferase